MASARLCLQWTVIVYNALSVVVGIMALIAAVYELDRFAKGSSEHTEKIVQLVAAAVLVLSTFLGCFGAVNGSIKILFAFIGILFVLIVAHAWKLWRYDETKMQGATEMLVNYTWAGAMDELQQMYECCGKRGFADYNGLGLVVPKSCFAVRNGFRAENPYREGCMTAIKRVFLTVYRYERWSHWGLLGFESLGIILTSILIYKLNIKTRRYRY